MQPTPKSSKSNKTSLGERLNYFLQGEVTTFQILQSLIGEFLAVSKRTNFLDSLVKRLQEEAAKSGDNDFKLIHYYEMMAMFIHEFKKVADKDPVVAEMIAAGERMAFLAQMGGPRS